MKEETRRYLDTEIERLGLGQQVKALWSWVEGGPYPCPICGQPGGFHSDEPVVRARREGELPHLRDMLVFPGHRQARADVPRELIKTKESKS